MRIDKFLKVSRIIKRRTVANDACDAAHISVNGRIVKASYDVKVGDVIEIAFGERVLRVRVTDVKDSTKKADAPLGCLLFSLSVGLEPQVRVRGANRPPPAAESREASEW